MQKKREDISKRENKGVEISLGYWENTGVRTYEKNQFPDQSILVLVLELT